ncbi:hypothetical protein NLJ89_g1904 [Agrocybe chaxingu]|uniref:Carboxylic ester hydrolase n=1 Tax=Agrocybe chaxingu TaxID=84603 RepID=A0A9W8MZ51_9AGAR|nr:hypothetical protein NLJ89_g1904 [Agrocybe chaxingu]
MFFRGFSSLLISAPLALHVRAASIGSSSAVVKLSYGSFEGRATGNLLEFFGIPFAAPPVGDLRFAPPVKPRAFKGVRQATAFAPACPQQKFDLDVPGLVIPENVSEDCLYLNVIKPANIPAGKKLPVLFVEFEVGDTSQIVGDTLVNRSITLGEPIVYVTASYRINAFGFLGGKEVKDAGIANAGLLDQRFALEWVQKYVGLFGGDAKKVTIWGISAGGISVGLQMLLNDGNTQGLFHRASMGSGSPGVLPDVLKQQEYFDSLVTDTNCTTARDRLKCLRDAPFDDLMEAINRTPNLFSFQSVRIAWQPMVDGKTIVRDPQISLQTGKYAKIPTIVGTSEDEGTIFSLSTTNLTTNAQFLDYAKSNFFPRISDSDLNALETLYPDDITQGSPFNTGTENAITPQFKRLSALQGDLVFQSPRRSFSQIASKTQPVYGYRFKRAGPAPLGSLHGGDLLEWIGNTTGLIGADAIIYFTRIGNPNASKNSISLLKDAKWPLYGSSVQNPPLFTFVDPLPSVNITFDTDRIEPMKLISKLSFNEIGNRGV